ncbi:MAG TPA: MFS transporter [Candidatus Limnocylindria bacterium]|nr:MFS transporter [Candidatus Limnocylindria bacterium]
MAAGERRGLPILFVSLVSIGIGQSMLFAVLPPAARELGVSPVRIATIFATSASIWVFASPWWGRRSDRIGRRPVMLIGLLGYAASMALMATTITTGIAGLLPAFAVYPALVASRCVFAVLGSGTGPAAQAYIADRTTAADRPSGMAALGAATGVGETLGPAIGAALAILGLTAPLYCAAVLAVGSAALIWRMLPETEAPQATAAPPRRSRWHVDRRLWPFLALATALQATRATTVITLALFLQDLLGLTATEAARQAGLQFVVLAGAGLVAQLVIVQRLRPSARTMIAVGAPLSTLAFATLALARDATGCAVALGMLGLGLGLVRPGTTAGASLSAGAHEQGHVAGVLGGLSVIGNVVGPVVGTSLYELQPIAPYVLNTTLMAAATAYALSHPIVRALRR